jgi:hypothetical protein
MGSNQIQVLSGQLVEVQAVAMVASIDTNTVIVDHYHIAAITLGTLHGRLSFALIRDTMGTQ